MLSKILKDLRNRIKLQILIAAIALLSMVIIGTVAYKHLENWSWGDSFYFSVTTITTVGYGDLHPTTGASRIFTAFYVLSGVAVAFTSLGIIGTNYMRTSEERLLARRGRRLKKDREDQEMMGKVL